MPSDSSVIADPANGAAIVAGTRVMMSAAENGALRFGGSGGRVLRPLTFGERTELVSAASALPASRDAVAAAILAAATLEHGAGATTLMEVLAMWLAGAAFDAPDFMETTLLVARGAGWPAHELFSAPAREVDRLAVYLDEQRRTSEWKSLVFAEAPAETIEAVRARFADRLLRRSASAVVEEPTPEDRASRESPTVPERRRPETRSLPDRAATAFQSEHTPPQRHATPIAQQQTTPTPPRSLEGPPTPEAAPAQPLTSPGQDAPTPTVHARPPSVRGIRLVVPREERDRPSRSKRAGSVAAAEQRPALAFTIRQPRPAGTHGAAEIAHATAPPPAVRTARAAPPLSKAAVPLPSGSAAHAHVLALAVAESVAVLREESGIVPLEPQRETRFPERALAHAPQFNAPHLNAPHADDLAATLAAQLDDEADLRGVER